MNTKKILLLGTTHHLVPYIVFGPVAVIAISAGVLLGRPSALTTGTFVTAGFAAANLLEYCIHRYSFHAEEQLNPISKMLARLNSGLHQLHHESPNRPDYVAAPVVLVAATYVVLVTVLILGSGRTASSLLMGGGVALGYLLYEYSHYAAHFRPASNRFARARKKHHMDHHFVDRSRYYGVSSPIWDFVFGTIT